MTETFQVRDVYNPRVVDDFAKRLHAVWPEFNKKRFSKKINPKLADLSYSERRNLIVDILVEELPADYPIAIDILLRAQLPPYAGEELESTNDRFIVNCETGYVARRGLDHFDLSMAALREMTMRFTSEWGIRPFIIQYPKKSVTLLKKWAKDKNPHVRRLVSEGSRPALPWGKKLQQFVDDPMPTLALLELLKKDSSEYVRRSVANHLNDHTKNHPDLIVETLSRWKSADSSKNTMRMIRHAVRTLVKNGHPGALELLGFKKGAKVKVEQLEAPDKIAIGDAFHFSFQLHSTGKKMQPVVIDYVLYFQKKDGSLAPKVFKMTTKDLEPGAVLPLKKKHSFKIISTRKYHPGAHALSVQVNGEELAKVDFVLVE